MRDLITGGAGFVGSHLAEHLLSLGHRVVALDDLSTGRAENVAHLRANPAFTLVVGQAQDEGLVERLVAGSDTVYHLAAAVGVRLVVEEPVRTVETNVLATAAVLRAAARARCRVLLASTSEVYGKGVRVPFHEEDDCLLGPTSRNRWCYAASKMVDEFLALGYGQEQGLPVIVARLFNTVGPRQSGQYGMVVPRFVAQALAGEPLTVYGDGQQVRCFADVRDVVRGLAALADCPAAEGQVVNLGSDRAITVNDLAALVIRIAASRSTVTHIPLEQAYGPGFEETEQRVPDISRARSLIGWEATIPVQETIRGVMDELCRSGRMGVGSSGGSS